ncbi:hypothetical protein GCM10009730_50880 [Streptomyces albidochromogenes]
MWAQCESARQPLNEEDRRFASYVLQAAAAYSAPTVPAPPSAAHEQALGAPLLDLGAFRAAGRVRERCPGS